MDDFFVRVAFGRVMVFKRKRGKLNVMNIFPQCASLFSLQIYDTVRLNLAE